MATPQLRFQEFDNKYKQTSFEKLKGFSIKSGKSNNKEESGEYPFYGSTGIIGYKSDYDYTGKAILIARVGANAGSLYQVDGKYSVSDNTLILAASDATNLDYVRELLVKFNLNRLVFGTGQPLVTGGLIKKVFISIPEVKEQTKIASFLSAVDDKIAQLTKEHELLSEYKKGMMQQLFSQKLRFKTDDGGDFEDWEDSNFENAEIQIIDGDRGNNYPKSEDFHDQGFCLFLNAGNVTKLGFRFENTQFIDEKKDSLLRKGKLKREDIIITTRGTVGNIAYFDNNVIYENMRINSGMVIVRSNKTTMPIYLNQFLTSNTFEKWIEKNVFGSAQPQLTVKLLKSIPISLPSTEEQTKIANFLSAIDQKIDNVAAQIDQAQVWKKGLLQQMFV